MSRLRELNTMSRLPNNRQRRRFSSLWLSIRHHRHLGKTQLHRMEKQFLQLKIALLILNLKRMKVNQSLLVKLYQLLGIHCTLKMIKYQDQHIRVTSWFEIYSSNTFCNLKQLKHALFFILSSYHTLLYHVLLIVADSCISYTTPKFTRVLIIFGKHFYLMKILYSRN